jgi:arylsulfatase A-like enzyme
MTAFNILYLHCHDAGRYIQPYGHDVSTPNLQRLAEEGVMFRNAFCCGPTCSPSRSGLVTGQCPHKNGMLGLAHRGFKLKNYSDHIVHQLHALGYESALAGVQHVATSGQVIGYQDVLECHEEGRTRDEGASEAAAAWLKQDRERPFFLSVGFFMPHRNYMDAVAAEGRDEDWRFVKPPPVIPDTAATRRDIADYNHSVKHMDRCCGTVLTALEEAGLADNTLVIATTDHGIAFPHLKCNLTDHGNGIYLIMKGPHGFKGGKCIEPMVSHLDIYPTLCDLLDCDPTHELDGDSLMPLVRGEVDALHEALFSEVTYHAAYEPKRAIRTERYKLIKRFDADFRTQVLPNCDDSLSKTLLCEHDWGRDELPEVCLFDLIHDPQERRNLADNPGFAEIRARLEQQLATWMRDTGDPLLSGPVPLPEGGVATPQHVYSPTLQG